MELWKETAAEQLSIMGFPNASFSLLREKDGITVCRVRSGDRRLVLKHFADEEDRREIENYRILNRLGIQTIPLIAHTDQAILLEDMESSLQYRLGIPQDLDDPQVTASLAAWYRKLHDTGRSFVKEHGSLLYDETDLITRESIFFVSTQSKTVSAPVWEFLRQRFDDVMGRIRSAKRTLAYNDFYYTNLIVSKDKSEAFMFDYNLLGKGYVLSDLRNVTYHMSEAAAQAFLTAYGSYDEDEIIIDRVASALTTLIFACRREEWPEWADEPLDKVRSGELLQDVKHLLNK